MVCVCMCNYMPWPARSGLPRNERAILTCLLVVGNYKLKFLMSKSISESIPMIPCVLSFPSINCWVLSTFAFLPLHMHLITFPIIIIFSHFHLIYALNLGLFRFPPSCPRVPCSALASSSATTIALWNERSENQGRGRKDSNCQACVCSHFNQG